MFELDHVACSIGRNLNCVQPVYSMFTWGHVMVVAAGVQMSSPWILPTVDQ